MEEQEERLEEYETLEEQVERLQPLVRPCVKHGNVATIEVEGVGEIILATECGCWQQCGEFESLEAAVEWWNERPYLDQQEKVLDAAYLLASCVKYILHNGPPMGLDDRREALVSADRVQEYVEKSMIWDREKEEWVRK